MTATRPPAVTSPPKSSTTAAPQNPGQLAMAKLKDAIGKRKGDIAKYIGAAMTPDRLVQICLSDVARNPTLLACRPDSIAYCLIVAAQFGLQLGGPMAEVYMVPRRNKHRGGAWEANPMIGYRGYCTMARRSKDIASLDAGVVYKGEDFRYDRATGRIEHPYQFENIERTGPNVVGAYAVARVKGSDYPIVAILSRAEIEDRRKRSSAVQSGKKTPWDTDYAAMCRKTAIRALLTSGLVPLTVEIRDLVEREREDGETIVPIAYDEPEIAEPEVDGQAEAPASDGPPADDTEVVDYNPPGSEEKPAEPAPAAPQTTTLPTPADKSLPQGVKALREAMRTEFGRVGIDEVGAMAKVRNDLQINLSALVMLDEAQLVRALRYFQALPAKDGAS